MRIGINENDRLITLWFSKDENPTGIIPDNLVTLTDMLRKRKYYIAVCLSGTQSIADVTTQLILRKMRDMHEIDNRAIANEVDILYMMHQ